MFIILLLCLTKILLLSLMLAFCCPSLRTLPKTSLLPSFSLSSMSIGIRRPVISLFFLLLSRGSFATPQTLIMSLLTSQLCVPLVRWLYDGVRPSFDWSSHGSRRRLLQPLPLLLLLLLFFFFFEWWCDARGRHGTAWANGCSPQYTHFWVV